MHKDGCPWKTKQCDGAWFRRFVASTGNDVPADSVYHIPLHSPTVMARDIKANASDLEPAMTDVEIKHPLVSRHIHRILGSDDVLSSQTTTQIQSLRRVLDSLPPDPSMSDDSESQGLTASSPPTSPQPTLSETAILTSLFGWLLFIPASEKTPPTPSFSRATSVSSSRAVTPAPAPTPIPSTPQHLIRMGTPAPTRDTSLLHCPLCRRRVGLWAFGPSPVPTIRQSTPITSDPAEANGTQTTPRTPPRRQFDLLREHRSYCPYVVKSTVLPSLPLPGKPALAPNASTVSIASLNAQNASAVEGWRAVLAVVLRHGMALRHRVGGRETAETSEPTEATSEGDDVGAMVAGVKSRGVCVASVACPFCR